MIRNRLVFVVNCLDVGGAEVQVVRLARGLIRRGWRVGVVSMLQPGSLAIQLRAMGAEVRTLGMRRGVPNPLAILRLRRILQQMQPQIVHSHIIHANLLTRLTRLIAPMHVLISSAHNSHESGRLLEAGYRLTDWLADLTTNVSQAAVERYIEVRAAPASRIQFMPNGLNFSAFRGDAAERTRMRNELGCGERFTWLAVGRFRKQKDYPNLLRAFAALHAREDAARPTTLMIAGTGEGEDEAKGLAASLGIADGIRFLGERSDIAALMNAADAFVLSSAWEGMPLVLQEAAASALPIVATAVGGNAEIALDGNCGFLVPPQDSVALADAMKRMMHLPAEDRERMGQAGRQHVVRHYGMEHVLDRWEAIYGELSHRRDSVRIASVAKLPIPVDLDRNSEVRAHPSRPV